MENKNLMNIVTATMTSLESMGSITIASITSTVPAPGIS